MITIGSPKKPLPPLATQTNYMAADFDHFEYFGLALTGSKAILRVSLKNGTTIDLPTTDDDLQWLLRTLIEAFPAAAIARLKGRGLV